MPPPPFPYNVNLKRQAASISGNTISIPSTYARQHSSPAPGAVVGIVLGSIAGFLFLLYLLYLALTSGRRFSASTITGSATMTTATPSEIVDVGIRPGRRQQRRRDRNQVIVEEEESHTHTQTHSGIDDGGVVEVIEEDSFVDGPPSDRSLSQRRYRDRSRSRSRSRESRYRRVDPSAYGGGSEFSGRS